MKFSLSTSLLSAALAGVIVLLLVFPRFHPDYLARNFENPSIAGDTAVEFLDRLGVEPLSPRPSVVLRRNGPLNMMLQDSLGRSGLVSFHNIETLAVWPVFFWRAEFGESRLRFGSDEEESFTMVQDEEVEFTTTHTINGELITISRSNPLRDEPLSLLIARLETVAPGWQNSVRFIPDSIKVTADPDMAETRIEQLEHDNAGVYLGRDFYRFYADKWLENTYWSSFEILSDTVFAMDNGQLAIHRDVRIGDSNHITELKVSLSRYGSLNQIETDWNYSMPSKSEQVIVGIGIGFMVIFIIVALIIFIRRYYHRLIDNKTAYIDGLLGLILMASAILLASLSNIVTGSLDTWWIILFSILGALFAGLFVGLLFYILSGSGNSVAHEVFPDKTASFNYARRGFWYNKPVGRSVYFGFLSATAAAGLTVLILIAAGNIPFHLGSNTLNAGFFYFLNDFSDILDSSIFIFIVLFGLFLACGLSLHNRFRNWKYTLILLLIPLLFLNLNDITIQSWPLSIIVNAVLAAVWVWLFRKFDILAVFMGMLVFILWMALLDGYIPFGWLSYHFITLIPVLAGIGLFGYVSYSKGSDLYDLPEYIPEYILEHSRRERIERELEIARQVQKNFLPTEAPQIEGLEVAAECTPAFEIGGDYYDFIRIDENRTAVLIGDVSGKGIEAAFYMTLVKGFVRSLCREITKPDELMTRMNTLFRENVPRGTFITMMYGIYDAADSTFTFVRSGHDPLLVRTGRKINLFQPEGYPLGMVDEKLFRGNIKVEQTRLEPGDAIVLFTDGFTETRNRRGEFLGDKSLKKILDNPALKTADDILGSMMNAVNHFRGGEPMHDDITTIVLVKK